MQTDSGHSVPSNVNKEETTAIELTIDLQCRLNALLRCLFDSETVDPDQYERYVLRFRAESDQICAKLRDTREEP